jgi:hypothetical protein
MHVEKLTLRNFKRFRELTIDLTQAQPPPRLVLLIGANGSGKSAVFDALEWVSELHKHGFTQRAEWEGAYYRKDQADPPLVDCHLSEGRRAFRNDEKSWPQAQPDGFHERVQFAFYGRSALRQVPRLTRLQSEAVRFEGDKDRPQFYTLPDERFENDLDLVISRILGRVFHSDDFDTATMRREYLDPINHALQRVFRGDASRTPVLTLLMPSAAGKPADVRFRKGGVEIHYDLLSSGEKAVFNILLDLFVRRDSYRDTVYFMDELDLHLHTALQYGLIQEIVEHWIPDGCQLWTASHSLGFIQYAQETEHSVIIDFDGVDFDLPQTLVPSPRASMDVFQIAVPKDLALDLFPQKRLMLCENQNDKLYNAIRLADTVFIGRRDKIAVGIEVRANDRYYGLIDRDYLADDEIAWIRKEHPRLFVLGYYAIENYLYHPNNIAEFVSGFDAQGYRDEIRRQKDGARDAILLGLQKTREGYELIKTLDRDRKRTAEAAIARALKSDDFETFYPFFDMKSKFDRSALAPYQLSPETLARTKWLRAQIEPRVR